MTDLSEKPGDQVAEHNGLVGLLVVVRRRDRRDIPEIRLPLVHVIVCRLRIEEKDPGRALDQPPPVQDPDAAVSHRLDGRSKLGDGGLHGLNLDGRLGFESAPEIGTDKRPGCREDKKVKQHVRSDD